MDASMLISTDDEMLDSDSDQRRDEDYDIDVDAEVYSVNGGDLEVTMTMEEDIVAYGRLEQDDNDDDIMLDDDPTDYGDGYDVHHGGHNIIATQTDTQLDVNSSMAPTMSQQETSFFQQLSPHQSNFNRQDPEASSSQPVLTQSDIGAAMTETQTTQPDNGGNRGDGEPVDVDPQQEQEQVPQQQPSPVSHQDIPSQSNILLEEEENDGTQSSTATLAHEVVRNDEQTAEENNDNTPVPKYQSQQELESSDADAGPVGTEDPFDSLYQHPVIVQYEQNQLTLFPSMADWSNDPVLANVYSDVPSDYLLPDVGVCEKTLSDLFMHLRDVLGPAVGLGSELVVEIELLGLKMGEDNAACKSVSLRRILDLHNQLQENDGYEIPMPVTMSLYTVPKFLSRLQEITDVVQERKGLQECLSRLGLPSVDEYSNEEDVASHHEADAADYSEKQTVPNSLQNPTTESREDKSPSPTLQQSEDVAEVAQIHEDAIAVSPETEHTDVVQPEAETQGSTQKELEVSHTHVIIQQPTSGLLSHSGSTIVDDEELLDEFEDGEGIIEEADTVLQSDLAELHENEPVAQNGADELPGAVDDVQSLLESDVAPVEPSTAELEVTEAEHPPSTVGDSDEHDTPPNLDDNSNKPSPIPVFNGDDEDQGEYDGSEQSFEERGYGQGESHHRYQEEGQQGTEHIDEEEQTHDEGEEEVHDVDAEGYADVHFQDDAVATEGRPHAESVHQEEEDGEYDAPGDYYDEGEGEYNQQDESVYIQTEAIEEYEVEEYDDSPYKSSENQSPPDEVEVIDPSTTDAIDITTIGSPAASTADDEEDLIDYEDEEEPVLLPQSPTSLKRVRDDSDAEGDDEVDADQAAKRSRAE
ncbi:hypothetical protein BZA05DRAFT_440258 [Tricharina praecox]|uniref:uncharacterized protein n=1 Tax=Tricharina praecox TaxID=43433 RepID=UPI00221F3015|nr:uncharacterized protein BZA05DRAFT_440258 [Tricharina praecox]KAI5858628.1 hypothetical protein BZA05DRAFT_440258 [Tricharina praecox]